MNRIIKYIVINTILKARKNKSLSGDFSSFELSKGFLQLKVRSRQKLKDVFLMALGIAAAAFGLKGFLLPSNFIDGGATGIALLSSEVFGIPLSLLLVVINAPFIFHGYKLIGKEFAFKTALAIATLAVVVSVVHFPVITQDKLLVAVFGGFCLGAGIGLSIRGGAVIDGTEVLAIFLSRKLGVTIGDVIIGVNVVIFGCAAYLLSVETALYSMITYLSAAKTMDFVIEGIEEYIGVTIISLKQPDIRDMIMNKLGRGVTVYTGTHGYGRSGTKKNVDIVYTVVTRLELSRLNSEIELIDKDAFVVMNSIKDTKGGMIKKRPLKH
jgi:uncharacterized membrane-anchored protein YitT (DUF2179 family)